MNSFRQAFNQQRFQATFQPKFTRFNWLNWFAISPVSYTATYGWSNGPVGRVTGANVNIQTELRGGLTVRPQEFWRKFDFYQTLEDQQRTAANERRQRQQAPAIPSPLGEG